MDVVDRPAAQAVVPGAGPELDVFPNQEIAREAVADHFDVGEPTVNVEGQAAGSARAVVGHGDMGPVAHRQLVPRADGNAAAGKLATNGPAQSAVLQQQVVPGIRRIGGGRVGEDHGPRVAFRRSQPEGKRHRVMGVPHLEVWQPDRIVAAAPHGVPARPEREFVASAKLGRWSSGNRIRETSVLLLVEGIMRREVSENRRRDGFRCVQPGLERSFVLPGPVPQGGFLLPHCGCV